MQGEVGDMRLSRLLAKLLKGVVEASDEMLRGPPRRSGFLGADLALLGEADEEEEDPFAVWRESGEHSCGGGLWSGAVDSHNGFGLGFVALLIGSTQPCLSRRNQFFGVAERDGAPVWRVRRERRGWSGGGHSLE
jgi:hypothetical protein